MFEEILQNVAAKAPLVHCITNYVTVNDCANTVSYTHLLREHEQLAAFAQSLRRRDLHLAFGVEPLDRVRHSLGDAAADREAAPRRGRFLERLFLLDVAELDALGDKHTHQLDVYKRQDISCVADRNLGQFRR